MVIVVDDDRKRGLTGMCENCGRDNVLVRPVQSVGWLNEPRGYYKLCFDCFRPRISWRPRGKHAQIYTSPVCEEE